MEVKCVHVCVCAHVWLWEHPRDGAVDCAGEMQMDAMCLRYATSVTCHTNENFFFSLKILLN